MRKYTWVLFILFLLVASAYAATTTTNYGMYKPAVGDTDWGDLINANFDTIDSRMKTNSDHISATGASHTYVDQDVTSGSSPTLDGTNITGVPAAGLDDFGTMTKTGGRVLVSDGTDFESINMSGAITIDVSGVTRAGTLTNNKWCSSDGTTINCTEDTPAAGVDELADLSDVDTSLVTVGNILIPDGAAWHSVAMSGDTSIVANGTVTIYGNAIEEGMLKAVNSPTDEYYLTYESTTGDFEWESSGGSGATTLMGLTDVGTVAPTTIGQILVSDGTDFEGVSVSGEATLNAAGAIDVTSLTIGDGTDENLTLVTADRASTDATILWDETNDEFDFNYPINVAGGSSTITMDVNTTGNVLVADGTSFDSVTMSGDMTIDGAGVAYVSGVSALELTNLTDVSSATVTAGRLLIADGTDWESVAVAGDCTLVANGSFACSSAASAGGSDTQIQYNNGGSLGGISTIIWDDTNLEFADSEDLAFGTDADVTIRYRNTESEWTVNTADTVGASTEYGLFLFAADTGNAGMTADAEIFEIGKGGADESIVNYTELLALDEDGDLSIAGDIEVASDVRHLGDSDTEIVFTTDTIALNAGSLGMIQIYEGATDEVVINDYQADINFRVETDSADNVILVDAGANTITLGAPVTMSAKFATDDNTLGNILVADGTDFESVAISGDATIASNGALDLDYDFDKCFTVGDSTITDDNIPVWSPSKATTITEIYCRTVGNGSSVATIHLSDGTNDLDDVACDEDGQIDSSLSNNTFTANELVEFDTVSTAGDTTWCNYCWRYTQ